MCYITKHPVRWAAQNALHFSSPDRPVHSDTNSASPGSAIFSTLVPGSGNFQLPDLAGFGYGLGLGFWVVFTINVSLTLITTITVILP